MLETEDRKIM